MALTPAQKSLVSSLYAEGKGPQAIATFLVAPYDDVWAYLQFEARNPSSNTLLEPRRRNLDEPGTSLGSGLGSITSSPVLQTNGVLNITQSVLNLIAGTNITLVANALGGVTISSTGGSGGSVLLETNSVANVIQNVLNLIAGTGISLASDAGGGVTITNTGAAAFVTQVANSVFAGPASGIAQLPAFRALVDADIPTLYTLAGLPTLKNVTFTNVAPQIITTGDRDLYTVPAGKRAHVSAQLYNSTGLTIVSIPKVKLGGVYYRVTASISNATVVGTSLIYNGYIFEAGETAAINTDNTGLSVRVNVILFDNTSTFKTVKAVLTSGDNTIYTCPVGKTAQTVGQLGGTGSANSPLLVWSNESGGALTYHWNIVPSGGTTSTTNQISTNAQSVANNAIASLGIYPNLTAGEFVSINSSGVGKQLAWFQVTEQ